MPVQQQQIDLDNRLIKAVDELMLELIKKDIHDSAKAADMTDKHLENYNVCVEDDGHGDVDGDYIQVPMIDLLKALSIAQKVHDHQLKN